jgi:hypothetical protein
MVDMSRLPNLSRCRTISRVPFGIGHRGTVIAPKTHRAALRRLNHASRFDNDSKHHSFAGQPVHLPMVRLGGFEPGFPFALGHDALVVSSAAKDWQRFLAMPSYSPMFGGRAVSSVSGE